MIRKILDMPNDSRTKTIVVALVLCLVCSVMVSTAAVSLLPLQEANQALDRKRNILVIAGMMRDGVSIDELFKDIEARVVDLDSGEFVDVDPESFDQEKAARDPAQSVQLGKETDIASIRRRPNQATVYLVRDAQDQLETIILPVNGQGLWAAMYGFIALEGDANTVRGFGFYQHGETPGLGGEVDNPAWRGLWPGRQVFDENGEVAIQVIKGTVVDTTPNPEFKVDGLAGATLTSRGVDNLVRFWMGEQGFKPFLTNISEGRS